MKLVKVKSEYYDMLRIKNADQEIMANELGRPCVLLIDMLYKNKKRKFVIPLRSNISPTVPKEQYLSLPPNPNTKAHYHHGVHYIKLFPIVNTYIDHYNIENNRYLMMIKKILDRKEAEIVSACKAYLKECENGNKHPMTPSIDNIIEILDDLEHPRYTSGF